LRYDVVVVGCGPSGASALRRCAELGLRSLGVEKYKLPRPKPCAGILYPRVLEDFQVPREAVLSTLQGIRLIAPSGKQAFIKLDPPGAIVDRQVFDYLLVQEAVKVGAELVEEARVRKVEVRGTSYQVYVEGLGVVEAKFLVAADGVYSTIARSLNLPWRKEDLALTMQTYVRVSEEARRSVEGIFEVYYDPSKILGGWIWVAGRARDVLVGIGSSLNYLNHPLKLKQRLTSFLKHRFKEPKVLKEEAYMLPFKGPKKDSQLVKGKTIFVGDAGGFVRSDTGEGVYYAMHSGLAAAEAIYDYLAQGGSLKDLYVKKLDERGMLQLYGLTEVHEALLSVEEAEAFIDRVRKLGGA